MAAASLAQGLTGFGFGIVAMAGLTPVVGPYTASLIVTPLAGANVCIALWDTRRHIHWRRVLPLWAGGAVGVPVGVQLLLHTDPLVLRRLVGVVILITAASTFWRTFPMGAAAPHAWGVLAGFAGGVLGGSVSMSGPPVVWYTYRQPWPLDSIRATLLLYFAGTIAQRFVMLAASGAYTPPMARHVVVLLPIVVAGTLVGSRLVRRTRRRQVDVVVAVLLVMAGVRLLLA
ncbi:MAG: sulfite exporter TauE/SafE family protein [Armatimonadota bacterium]|nr:sulfite exporter TauE/SafE family protein [Armatimonadota bacterium]